MNNRNEHFMNKWTHVRSPHHSSNNILPTLRCLANSYPSFPGLGCVLVHPSGAVHFAITWPFNFLWILSFAVLVPLTFLSLFLHSEVRTVLDVYRLLNTAKENIEISTATIFMYFSKKPLQFCSRSNLIIRHTYLLMCLPIY